MGRCKSKSLGAIWKMVLFKITVIIKRNFLARTLKTSLSKARPLSRSIRINAQCISSNDEEQYRYYEHGEYNAHCLEGPNDFLKPGTCLTSEAGQKGVHSEGGTNYLSQDGETQMAYTICRQCWTGVWVGTLPSLFSLACPIAQKPPLGEMYGMWGGLHLTLPFWSHEFWMHTRATLQPHMTFFCKESQHRSDSFHPDARSISLIWFLGRNIVSVILTKYFNPCLGLGGWWEDIQ